MPFGTSIPVFGIPFGSTAYSTQSSTYGQPMGIVNSNGDVKSADPSRSWETIGRVNSLGTVGSTRPEDYGKPIGRT